MTVAELYQWAATRHWGQARIERLEHAFQLYLIIPVDIEMCRIWGAIRAECQRVGIPISPQDAWIAATALRYAIPLVTHNPSDYQAISGLDVRTAPV